MVSFDKLVRGRFGKAHSHKRIVNVGLHESQRPCRKAATQKSHNVAGIYAHEKMGLVYLYFEQLLSVFKLCLVVGLNFGVHLDLIRGGVGLDFFDLDRLEIVSRSRFDGVLCVTRTPRIRKPVTCIYLRVTVPSASIVTSRPDTHASHALSGARSAPKPDVHGLQAWGASGPKAGRDGLKDRDRRGFARRDASPCTKSVCLCRRQPSSMAE